MAPLTAYEPIAIVGIACRLPGDEGDIRSTSQLWQFLHDGRTANGKLPESRFNIDKYRDPRPNQPGTTKALGGYFLQDDLRNFDNQFFGINNREAAAMDPQQRKLLEVVFECFENAGVTLNDVNGEEVGCYVASFTPDNLAMQTKDMETITRLTQTGMGTTVLANRISNVFNLKGPSCVLDTACSSSFYALHSACLALQAGDCKTAVAAGVNLIQSPEFHVALSQVGVISPNSASRTFDVDADGYGRADGVNALYLKRLSDAVRDGDSIRSVIRASALNANGRTSGVSQPSADGQEAVIRKAYAKAGLSPSDTPYIECHGTGTSVGDPMEVEALSRVFQRSERDRDTLIGGVKPNLGHGEAASGLTSVIKATLAIENSVIPATVGIKTLNPKIRTKEWGVQVVSQNYDWSAEPTKRISLSSFGYGGANAHAILEAPPLSTANGATNSVHQYQSNGASNGVSGSSPDHHNGTTTNGHGGSLSNGHGQSNGHNGVHHEDGLFCDFERNYLLPFSANKSGSLEARVEDLSRQDLTRTSVQDLAYTLGSRRSHLATKGYIVTGSPSLAEDIQSPNLRNTASGESLPFAFVFTGQGAQWAGMARELLLHNSVFSTSIQRLDSELTSLPHAPAWSIRDVLLDASGSSPINQAALAQPITTAIQISLVDVLKHWGVEPQAVIGHSSGEISAAYAAGLITSREAISAAFYRGFASAALNSGAMAAVGLSQEAAASRITELGLQKQMRVACINSPESATISGDAEAIDSIVAALVSEGKFARKLKTDGKAYHSHHMLSVGKEYERLLDEAAGKPQKFQIGMAATPSAKMFSTVAGEKLPAGQILRSSYWRMNLESPVRFSDGVAALASEMGKCHFIEIGPHSALQQPVKQTLGAELASQYSSALVRGKDAYVTLLSLLGDLWMCGNTVNFHKVNGLETQRPKLLTSLPPYPWRYEEPLWVESRINREIRNRKNNRHELLGSEVPGGNGSTFGWRNLMRLENIPWLADHKLGDEVVCPGAAYLCMAMEAAVQVTSTPLLDAVVTFRHVDFIKALPLKDDSAVEVYTELQPVYLSNMVPSKHWWHFSISSIKDDTPEVLARGSVKVKLTGTAPHKALSVRRLAPQSTRLWYDAIIKGGLNLGPTFQLMSELSIPDPKGENYVRAKTHELGSLGREDYESRYLIHPCHLDCIMQAGLIAGTGGFIQDFVTKIPTRLSHARITSVENGVGMGEIETTSRVVSCESLRIASTLTDASGRLLVDLRDVDLTRFPGVEVMEERNPILRVRWKPDLDLLPYDVDGALTEALNYNLSTSELGLSSSNQHLLSAVDLLAHKNPGLKVICLSTDKRVIASLLIEVLEAQTGFRRFDSFALGRLSESGLEVADVINFSVPMGLESLSFRKASSDDKYEVVVLPIPTTSAEGLSIDQIAPMWKSLEQHTDPGVTMINTSVFGGQIASQNPSFNVLSSRPTPSMFGVDLIKPASVESVVSHSAPKHVLLVNRDGDSEKYKPLGDAIGRAFELSVQQHEMHELVNPALVPADSLLISTVELESPLLAYATADEFTSFKNIVGSASKIVWLTGSGVRHHKAGAVAGAPLSFDPTLSMMSGLARAIMIEQPSTKIFSLELDSSSLDFDRVCSQIQVLLAQPTGKADYEYLQNETGLMVSRTVPDTAMNQVFRERRQQLAINTPLASAGPCHLGLQRPGHFSSARFTRYSPRPLAKDAVRVKVKCMGLNAKDVYALGGRVTTTNASCSLEFTGEVVETGSSVTGLAPGDKVAVMYPTHFGTYETVPEWACAKLRDGESMHEMAAVLLVYTTAMFALQHRAQLQAGETVLIHSAAGGVGIAAIQLAKLIGAEVFATVGTEEKKQFLVETFGIRSDHIFSSRDSSFLPGIMAATEQRGVDVVLNSLTGDLLHDSWRCIANWGRFVEIGKKDIHENGKLDMEVLERGATFSAFDISALGESDSPVQQRLYQSLISKVVALIRSGGITPIRPLAIFPVANIAAAFNHFSSSKRIGKIVVSFEDLTSMIPVVPERYSTIFDANKSYLLVGALGGLGRSLSKWMLSRGARKFIFIGRTGTQRPAARRLVDDLEKSGAKVVVVTGDVTNFDDAQRAVQSAPAPIGGVIQAAMGLNEAIFSTMSHGAWHTGIDAKVQGTWNLHNALAGHDSQLDFFAMTSSISGKVATATEGNYCAANNFLDTFARYRRSLGLPAISLGLGMISEVGYLHENPEIEDLLMRKGIRPITEDELLQIFDMALSSAPTSADPSEIAYSHILTGLEPTNLQAQRKYENNGYWQFLNDPRFLPLTCALQRSGPGDAAQAGISQSSAIMEAVKTKEQGTVVEAVQDVLAKKLSSLILLPVDKLDVKTSLSDFGIDSMLAAELRQFIFQASAVDVPFLTIMDKSTNVLGLAQTAASQLLAVAA